MLAGLIVGACNLVQIKPVAPAPGQSATGIIFVTATPRPQLFLREGQRVLSAGPVPAAATPALPRFTGANELGQVLVLEYHRIGYPEQRFQRTPENFRADLQRLYDLGYYPVNFIDLLNGLPSVPPGKKPVVLTFDDSDVSQFRVLSDNTIDADSAVGILLDFHTQHPADWPTRATFFVLGDDTDNYSRVFGQPKWAKAKLRKLVELGMEIGGHTVNHVDLSVATAERIEWELAISKRVIEDLVPGYTVQTMAVPFGGFPFSIDFLKSGQWGGYEYHFVGNAAAWGGPGLSPYDPSFEPYRVSRLEVTETSIDHWLTYFAQNPQDYYLSDGDNSVVTVPELETASQ